MRFKNQLIIFLIIIMFHSGGLFSCSRNFNIVNSLEESSILKLNDTTIPLWSYTLDNKKEYFCSVSISSNGSYIAALSGENCTVYLFHKSSPVPLWNYTIGGEGRIIAISADGNYIVAGNGENCISFFEKSNNKPIWNYTGMVSIYSLAISSNGTYLVAACALQGVLFFHKSSPDPLWVYETVGNAISVDITSNATYLVAGDNQGNCYFFNKSSNIPMWNFSSGEDDSICFSSSISSNGNYFYIGTQGMGLKPDNSIYYFKKDDSKPKWKYYAENSIMSIKTSSDGKYLVAGSKASYIYMFDNSSSVPLWNYRAAGLQINSVDMSLNGDYITAKSWTYPDKGDIYLFHRMNSNPIWHYYLDNCSKSHYFTISISDDGKYIATNSYNTVYLFDRDIVFAPQITINSPNENEIFGKSAPNYEITISDPYNTIWYTIDEGITNITTESLMGIIEQTEWDKKEEGMVTIMFYVNNSIGLKNEAYVQIFKNLPSKISGFRLDLLLGMFTIIVLIIIRKQKKIS